MNEILKEKDYKEVGVFTEAAKNYVHGQVMPNTVASKASRTLEFKPQDVQGSIENTLAQRQGRYGDFKGHADITQSLKKAMYRSRNWDVLAADQKETLEMIAHKIGRILNGDPNYHDSWHDIIGYTKLVADRIEAQYGR